MAHICSSSPGQLSETEGLERAMVWALDLDDFSGSFCKQGQYPLIRTLQQELSESGDQRLTQGEGYTPSPLICVSEETSVPQYCDFSNCTYPRS